MKAKRAQYTIAGMSFDVLVIGGPRVKFGRTDYQIQPVAGSGSTWVNEKALQIKGGK